MARRGGEFNDAVDAYFNRFLVLNLHQADPEEGASFEYCQWSPLGSVAFRIGDAVLDSDQAVLVHGFSENPLERLFAVPHGLFECFAAYHFLVQALSDRVALFPGERKLVELLFGFQADPCVVVEVD
jgi:hypothetical protein